MLFRSRNKGFTVIELLITVSIISFLSVVVLISVDSARSKARDSKRIQEIRQIRTAMELYRLDYGKYPTPTAGWISSTVPGTWNTLVAELAPYIKLQVDPINTSNGGSVTSGTLGAYMYSYYADPAGYYDGIAGQVSPGRWYMLIFRLENKNINMDEVDGVKTCTNEYFDYPVANNNDGFVITTGANC